MSHRYPTKRGRARAVTSDEERAVTMAFQAGVSAAEIARVHSRDRAVIYRILQRAGLKPITNHDQRVKHSQALVDQVVAYYRTPHWLHETARHFGLGYSSVRKMLARRGELRDDGRRYPFTDAELRRIKAEWEAGDSQSAIAKRLDVSQATIGKTLRRFGFETARRHATGNRHGAWKGGVCQVGGYRFVCIDRADPFSVMANGNGYVAEHRLVMARSLGRPLARAETVHHIDGNRAHNDLANLQMWRGRHGAGQSYQCADCGSRNIVPTKLL